ncbi:hypothetical protein ODR10_16480, partial [Escherichia coli]|nr:hypothetical protein [Escherichia coli]
HAERETTGVEGKAERLTWHKAWTAVSSGFSISYTSSMYFRPMLMSNVLMFLPKRIFSALKNEKALIVALV